VPTRSVADQPLHIAVRGVHRSQLVRIALRSTDALGTTGTSAATFRSDTHREVDLDRAPAISGSYVGVAGMGLVWSMQPAGDPRYSSGLYFWAHDNPMSWNVEASIAGKTVAIHTFTRVLLNLPVDRRPVDLDAAGFAGELFTPPPPPREPGIHPAILLIGGSEGGIASTLEGA
jgi:Acyl-CoA thioester hydrolase/BAAT N-terminal region